MLCNHNVHCFFLCKAPPPLQFVSKTDEQQLTVQRLMAIQFTAQHGQWNGKWMDVASHSSVTPATKQPTASEGVCAQCDAIFPYPLWELWVMHQAGRPSQSCAPLAALKGWAGGGTLSLLTSCTRQPCSFHRDCSLVPNIDNDFKLKKGRFS